jgi:sterol desaturase/sphingolipid hydroxylase (fatty acid hydroxylase superfamily)
VDITTSLRNHPLDVVGVVMASAVAVVLLGAAPAHVAIAGTIGALFGLWDHARLVLPARVERALAWLIQTPGMHRVHHSPTLPETNTNYGLVFSCWDRLFRSYSPPNPRLVTGLDTLDLAARQTVRAMLAEPIRPLVKAHPSHDLLVDSVSP